MAFRSTDRGLGPVFSELAKLTYPLLHTIRYWRSKAGAKVDFVGEHRGRLPL